MPSNLWKLFATLPERPRERSVGRGSLALVGTELYVADGSELYVVDGRGSVAKVSVPSGLHPAVVRKSGDGDLWVMGGNAVFRRRRGKWQRVPLPIDR